MLKERKPNKVGFSLVFRFYGYTDSKRRRLKVFFFLSESRQKFWQLQENLLFLTCSYTWKILQITTLSPLQWQFSWVFISSAAIKHYHTVKIGIKRVVIDWKFFFHVYYLSCVIFFLPLCEFVKNNFGKTILFLFFYFFSTIFITLWVQYFKIHISKRKHLFS